jgi:hypothetical protein
MHWPDEEEDSMMRRMAWALAAIGLVGCERPERTTTTETEVRATTAAGSAADVQPVSGSDTTAPAPQEAPPQAGGGAVLETAQDGTPTITGAGSGSGPSSRPMVGATASENLGAEAPPAEQLPAGAGAPPAPQQAGGTAAPVAGGTATPLDARPGAAQPGAVMAPVGVPIDTTGTSTSTGAAPGTTATPGAAGTTGTTPATGTLNTVTPPAPGTTPPPAPGTTPPATPGIIQPASPGTASPPAGSTTTTPPAPGTTAPPSPGTTSSAASGGRP